MNSTLAPTPKVSVPLPRSTLYAGLFLATFGFLWFMLCRQLSYEWSANEQYSYGWFVPFFAAFLFWLRWEDWGGGQRSAVSGQGLHDGGTTSVSSLPQKHGQDRVCPSKPPTSVLCLLSSVLLLLLLPVRLFEVANPDWRPLSWLHALIVVGLTLLAIWYYSGWRTLRHFAFPVCFILVAVPWVTPIEGPIVQGLMRLVAAVATETLTLFGIPAQLEGSLIRINNGVVGVSEACSGVRSLQTSLMIGLLFGELKRLTIGGRVVLVAAALTIALLANFARAFFLVWIAATQNLPAVEHWHDLAGYAIVGAVFLGTVAGAAALGRVEGRAPSRPRLGRDSARPSNPSSDLRPPTSALRLPPSPFILLIFFYLLFVEVAVQGWYRWHERELVPATSWSVRWPKSLPGFHELQIDQHTRETLRYDEGDEVSWPVSNFDGQDPGHRSAAGRTAIAFLYFFRWEAGTATVLRARAHRPDICLPATGWHQVGPATSRSYGISADLALPFQHFAFVRKNPGGQIMRAETFFCLREDRVRPEELNRRDNGTIPFSDWSIGDRWRAVREGLRNPGQQVLEFALVSPEPRTNAEVETQFAALVPKLVKVEDQGVAQ